MHSNESVELFRNGRIVECVACGSSFSNLLDAHTHWAEWSRAEREAGA